MAPQRRYHGNWCLRFLGAGGMKLSQSESRCLSFYPQTSLPPPSSPLITPSFLSCFFPFEWTTGLVITLVRAEPNQTQEDSCGLQNREQLESSKQKTIWFKASSGLNLFMFGIRAFFARTIYYSHLAIKRGPCTFSDKTRSHQTSCL